MSKLVHSTSGWIWHWKVCLVRFMRQMPIILGRSRCSKRHSRSKCCYRSLVCEEKKKKKTAIRKKTVDSLMQNGQSDVGFFPPKFLSVLRNTSLPINVNHFIYLSFFFHFYFWFNCSASIDFIMKLYVNVYARARRCKCHVCNVRIELERWWKKKHTHWPKSQSKFELIENSDAHNNACHSIASPFFMWICHSNNKYCKW